MYTESETNLTNVYFQSQQNLVVSETRDNKKTCEICLSHILIKVY